MNAIRTSLFVVSLLFVCTLSAQKKEKFNEKEYTTNGGVVLKAGETYKLGIPTGEKFATISEWLSGPDRWHMLLASHSGIAVTIIKFKQYDGIVYALFEFKNGLRQGIAVEASILKGEFIISKEVK